MGRFAREKHTVSDKRSGSPSSTDITAAYGDGEERAELSPVTGTGTVVKDAVFGEINGESGPDFRSVSHVQSRFASARPGGAS